MENSVLTPLLFSSVFILFIIALCFLKPNAGRIVLGIFFILMAIVVNGVFTFSNPTAYIEYASDALVPIYRELAILIVSFNPMFFGLILIIYELLMGLLLLYKGIYVKIGLIGTMIFIIWIAPLSYLQFPWLGLLISQIYLLTKNFKVTFYETIQSKFIQ